MNEREKEAYRYGFDCGKYGPTIMNCHFTLFATPELTKAWERGKADGERANAESGEWSSGPLAPPTGGE